MKRFPVLRAMAALLAAGLVLSACGSGSGQAGEDKTIRFAAANLNTI